jgi:hypothetical protein
MAAGQPGPDAPDDDADVVVVVDGVGGVDTVAEGGGAGVRVGEGPDVLVDGGGRGQGVDVEQVLGAG